MDGVLDPRGWKELGVSDKFKLTIAGTLVLSAIILGFISFIILLEIPGSVIATMGLWLSAGLSIIGIASYFHNEMVQFQGKVTDRLNRMDKYMEEK